jgi:molybdenum cofactor cytidylyltransferase
VTRGDGEVFGVVPAAGRSSRIGNPKPLLDADGATFLERTVGALREAGVRTVYVGVREERSPIGAMAGRTGARTVVPQEPERGPLATLQAVLAARRTAGEEAAIGAFVYLPVDHPLVQPATVRALIEGWRETGAQLVVPLHRDRRGYPILLDTTLLRELASGDPPAPGEGEEDVAALLHPHDPATHLVEVDDQGVLVDIDTLAEYRRHFPAAYRRRFQKW